MERIVETFEHGTVTWRLPNIIEETRILGRLGFSMSGRIKDPNDFAITANAMEAVGGLVEAIDVKVDDEKIETWDRLIEVREFGTTLAGMATRLLNHCLKVTKKKKEDKEQTADGDQNSPVPSRKKKKT